MFCINRVICKLVTKGGEKRLDDKNLSLNAAKAASKALDEKFGQDVVILDISKISIIADYFVIASGNNPAQIQAMTDACEEACAKEGLFLKHSEGRRDSAWCLLDFGSIIVHIFYRDDRGFYNLERVWGDAEVIKP